MTTTEQPWGDPGPVQYGKAPWGDPGGRPGTGRVGDAEDRADIPRDPYDRYLMQQLDGTKPAPNKGFTRVSTTKSALSNTIGIQRWSGKRIVQGIGQDPKAVEASIRAAAMPEGPEREKAFGRIAEQAFRTGGGKERSGLGTEFHMITEEYNRGNYSSDQTDEIVKVGGIDVSKERRPDLAAYLQMLIEHDVTILPDYLERQVLCPFNQAGTFDNIVRYWNPETCEYELLVADLKTGRDLTPGWLEILIQLWSYANALAMWTTTKVVRNDPKDPAKITDVEGFYEPMPPELRTDKALIFHVPLDGTATLYVLDLSGVERAVRAAVEAKRWNAEAKLRVRSVGTVRPDAFTAPESPKQITEHPMFQGGQTQAQADRERAYTNQTPAGPVRVPTPDQVAQEKKAAERTAVAAETLKRAASAPGMMSTVANIEDKAAAERDPVTGRKKRTCGHCRKPGHTQKNCPENPDSPKYVPPVRVIESSPEDITLDQHMAGLAQSHGGTFPVDSPAPPSTVDRLNAESVAENNCDHLGDGNWHPYVAGQCRPMPKADPATYGGLYSDTEPSSTVERLNAEAIAEGRNDGDAPWCEIEHTHAWTSQHPKAPGQWVCSVSGKPGRMAYENQATAVTSEPPNYGRPTLESVIPGPVHSDYPFAVKINGESASVTQVQPEYQVGDKVTVGGIEFTKYAEPPSPWESVAPPDMVMWTLNQAPTRRELLAYRDTQLAAGTWLTVHDDAAKTRYPTLPE